MTNEERKAMDKFGVLDKMERLERTLLAVPGVKSLEYDLNGFYDDLNEVIFLAEFDPQISIRSKYALKTEIAKAAKACGLERTGDAVEDFGSYLYFVTDCTAWEPNKAAEVLNYQHADDQTFEEDDFSME